MKSVTLQILEGCSATIRNGMCLIKSRRLPSSHQWWKVSKIQVQDSSHNISDENSPKSKGKRMFTLPTWHEWCKVSKIKLQDCLPHISDESILKSKCKILYFLRVTRMVQNQSVKSAAHPPSVMKSVQSWSVKDFPRAITDEKCLMSKFKIAHAPSMMKSIQKPNVQDYPPIISNKMHEKSK